MVLAAIQQRLRELGQEHLLGHAQSLSVNGAADFARELDSLDADLLSRLREALSQNVTTPSGKLEPLPQIVRAAVAEEDAVARTLGEALLREGRVAAFLVAGGQGTRLGLSGPKGKFGVGAVSGASLFEIFAHKLLRRGRSAGRAIPWCIMTSPENDAETQAHFRDHNYFGLQREDVFFFVQGTLPALDSQGRLLLRSATTFFRSPDGHGGSLRALAGSGALQRLRERGIQHLFYFQVDNPLVDICDPVFVGYHAARSSEFSSKSVPKRSADEKVGVLGRINGQPGVIEYSDLAQQQRDARDATGALQFRAGNIAVHVLALEFVERICSGALRLPWHLARKSIPCFEPCVGPAVRDGTKFELFIFDAMPLARATLVMEVRREDEFSPVKNREGADSPESCLRDCVALHARWLECAGASVPRGSDGTPSVRIEISPLTALGPEDLQRWKGHVFSLGEDISI